MFVAPFVLEKDFPNAGKIFYITVKDISTHYPNRLLIISCLLQKYQLSQIFRRENLYFSTILSLQNIHWRRNSRWKGDVKTSSLLLSNSTNNPQDLHAKQFVIYDKTGKTRHIYNNVTLAGLMKLIGKNEITINSTGKLFLPRMGSQHDYVGISVPT